MPQGANLEHTREFNRRAVVGVLRRAGVASRTEIAHRTGLSLSAVSNLVEELVRDGWVAARGRRTTARGQPPIEYQLAPDGAFGVGVAVDRDHAAAVLLDLTGAERARSELALSAPSVPEAAACIADLCRDLLAQLSSPERARVAGRGVSVPGVVGRDGRRIERIVRLPDWEGAELARRLEVQGAPATTLTNDAVAAAVGETCFGAAGRGGTFFYALFALGLGSALVMNGRPYGGLWGFTGRLGHIPIDPDGPVCAACGGRGCLSLYASVEALHERLRAAGAATGPDATAARLAAGDPTVDAWIEGAGRALARGVIVLENLLDPDALVLDGRMPVQVLTELAGRARREYMQRRPATPDRRPMELAVAERGRFAAAFGAAAVPLYRATDADLALVR